MANDFVGTGWRFPIQPDATGTLGYTSDDANVQQSLKVLLMTAFGERVMRYQFGCQAPNLVFAPGSVQFLNLLQVTVRDAVRDWEPRVDLDDVTAEADPNDPTRVTVSIDYRVRRTNTSANLVFPFYLGNAENS
jgi:hypothetical protein